MFNVEWGYPIKRPYISLTTAPRGLGCETICRKSRPGNLSQVLNLTFDPCLKAKWDRHTKTSLYLAYYWLHNVNTAHGKSLSANDLPVNNFGLILKNKMATIANYLKII